MFKMMVLYTHYAPTSTRVLMLDLDLHYLQCTFQYNDLFNTLPKIFVCTNNKSSTTFPFTNIDTRVDVALTPQPHFISIHGQVSPSTS